MLDVFAGSREYALMGQESGKAAWPKPAGGYQTVTGRRYGRRHAYVSFRPSIAKPWKHLKDSEHQWEGMELNTVSKDNGLSASGILSTNELLSQCTGCDQTMDLKREVDFEAQKENRFLPSPLNRRLVQCESSEFVLPCTAEPLGSYLDSQNTETPKWSIPSDYFETTSRSQAGIGLENIDSCEPESSEGEDEFSSHSSLQKEEKLQKRLETMLSELEKGVDYLNGLQSYLSAVIHDGSSQPIESPCSVAMDNLSDMDIAVKGHQSELKEHQKPLPALENVEKINGYVKMEEIKEKRERNHDKSLLDVQAEGNIFYCKTEQPSSSEMVVRPKVRKERTDAYSKRDLHSSDDLYGHCTKEIKDNIECCGSNFALWNCMDKIHKDSKLESGSIVKGTTAVHKVKNTNQQENPGDAATESSFWDDFENDCNLGEESSFSSGEEWSAIWTSDFALEKMHSSDESWETLSGVEEQLSESNSISSSLDEEAFDHCFTVGEPTSLEEGEIPWVAFNEESDSTSSSSSGTDETEGLDQLGHSGLLILNDSNNFEDDSSTSEDLDMEWRLLDELGEGLAAQAISSVDPQLLTFMALEERLAQAMEAALAHLESLAIDGEQAPPPAPKETIDCLPQVCIAEDHNGLEQSCAICCSEYVKEELVSELPCHHLFHRPCVTLWLQKSGTCPVCRHILASARPEAAAAATTFLSEAGTPPSTRDGPTIR